MITCIPIPSAVPDPPGTPDVIDIDADAVTLSWTRPKSDGGKKVQGYIVEMKEADGRKWKPVTDFPVKDNMYKGQSYQSV